MAKIGQFADSVQQIIDLAEFNQFYETVSGTIVFGVAPGGPFADRYYQISSGDYCQQSLVGAASGDEVYWSGYVYFATATSGSIVQILDTGGVEHIRLSFVAASQKLTVGRTTTVLGTTTQVFALSTWYGIELRGKIDEAAGYIHLYVDGASAAVLSVTGADTQNGGVATPGFLRLTCAGIARFSHHLCITDSSAIATLNAPRLPEFMPTADTAQEDFAKSTGSDSWAMLDETPGDDGDTTYIESSTVGHITRVTGAGLSYTPATIHFVVVNLVSRKDDAGARTARIVIKSGATTANGTTQTIGTTYRHYQDFWFTDPNTAAAWTKSAVDALEFGVEVVA